MIFETTLNISKENLVKIDSSVEETGYKRNFIIVLLLKYAMKDHALLYKQKSTVKYQNDDSQKKWKTVHVWFSDREYVFCINMRMFFRMSVSLILAYSVTKYLKEITDELLGVGNKEKYDNNLFNKYDFQKITKSNGIIWKQIWRKPGKNHYPPQNRH